MGGSRFVGKALTQKLSIASNEVTLFTRGNLPVASNFEHLLGDRNDDESLAQLNGRKFDVIIDSSGRTLEDTKRVLKITGRPTHRFLYVSSAGVYAKSNKYPIKEDFKIDPDSRHSGKFDTESWLIKQHIPFTSFRPTYIYGPGNYNPIERWFFDRITRNKPVPVPGDGQTLTQLGHVEDLAEAMYRSISCNRCINKIYNCSSNEAVTITGLIHTAIKVCGKNISDVEIRSFDTSKLDPKARKLFPIRLNHFYTDITNIKLDLEWTPNYNLERGLLDSYENDYIKLPSSYKPDFTPDSGLFSL